MHYQAWGAGDPVIALHPLALESSMFAGVARELGAQGFRTLAADLPGFGRTPTPVGALTAARLAEPVIELARSLETPPLVLGMSLGGRVALEAALLEPTRFAGSCSSCPFFPGGAFAGPSRSRAPSIRRGPNGCRSNGPGPGSRKLPTRSRPFRSSSTTGWPARRCA